MINIKKITKLYQTHKDEKFYALRDISLTIKKGTLCILQGKSGSGKSTLLSIIASITKPTSGEVNVNGENISLYSDFFASRYREKTIGFITQEFHLFDGLNVEENISIALSLSTLTPQEIVSKVYKIAQELQISDKLKSKVSSLSGGEKQRCIIARAIVNNPEIILCDEPTANLDKENSLKFIDILTQLKKMNKTIIVATHDPLFDSLSIVDSRHHIQDGKIE